MPKDTLSIQLLKPHRHAGRDYLPGQTLVLAAHQAQWLIAQGVAKAPTAPAPTPAPAASSKTKE